MDVERLGSYSGVNHISLGLPTTGKNMVNTRKYSEMVNHGMFPSCTGTYAVIGGRYSHVCPIGPELCCYRYYPGRYQINTVLYRYCIFGTVVLGI